MFIDQKSAYALKNYNKIILNNRYLIKKESEEKSIEENNQQFVHESYGNSLERQHFHLLSCLEHAMVIKYLFH